MESMSARYYTSTAEGSSDCTFGATQRWETSGCTAAILAVVSLAARLQWILSHRVRDDGRPWKPTPLSVAAGLGRNHIAQMLDGRVGDPDLATLGRIARVANVSPAWLAMGAGSPDDSAPVASEAPQRFGDLAGWRDLLTGARVRRPTMPAWVWDRVARSYPLEGAAPTVAAVIHAADGVLEQTVPATAPENRTRA